MGEVSGLNPEERICERQFSKANGSALVGSSESAIYILDKVLKQPNKEPSFLCSNDLTVKAWNCSGKGTSSFGSLIAFTMNSAVKGGQKLRDVNNFIIFCKSDKMYQLALKLIYGRAPRYLLPPYRLYYLDSAITNYAPLYMKFYPIDMKMTSFTEEGMLKNTLVNGKKYKRH